MANVELPNGSNIGHAPHDSALSVGSSRDDAIRIRDLEDEVRILAEKANSACMHNSCLTSTGQGGC